ncbi:MAG: alpha/beta hydrolase [Planctomycetaceae bacterium]
MSARMPRREFLKVSSGCAVAASVAPFVFAADDQPPRSQTFTYKKIGDLELQADVYRPAGDEVSRVPVAIWIHGGALIMGSRRWADRRLTEGLLRAGYAVVSIDYRLAPETKAPEILVDVADACRWVREKGPELFHADGRRIAVMGGSAGGYLTLTTGYRVQPRPAALVSLYGYGDLPGAWYSQPSEHYRKQPLVSRESAYAAVGTKPLADGSQPGDNRGPFYLYCRQQGLWPKEVTGYDPQTEDKAYDALCPLRNMTPEYPPTLLIHGTIDSDVPYEQSVLMDRELTRHGVEHKLIAIEKGEHGLLGGDKEKIEAAYDEALAFVRRHLPKDA